MKIQTIMPMLKQKPRGLGDVVAIIAKPIAAASDAILKTNFKNCPGCNKRIRGLNAAVPFNKGKK